MIGGIIKVSPNEVLNKLQGLLYTYTAATETKKNKWSEGKENKKGDKMDTVAPLAPVTSERMVRTDLEDSLPKPCNVSLPSAFFF